MFMIKCPFTSLNRLEICDSVAWCHFLVSQTTVWLQSNCFPVEWTGLCFTFSRVRCSYRLIGIGLCDFVFCVTSKMEYAILWAADTAGNSLVWFLYCARTETGCILCVQLWVLWAAAATHVHHHGEITQWSDPRQQHHRCRWPHLPFPQPHRTLDPPPIWQVSDFDACAFCWTECSCLKSSCCPGWMSSSQVNKSWLRHFCFITRNPPLRSKVLSSSKSTGAC